MLQEIYDSGLAKKASKIFITALGSELDRNMTRRIILEFAPKANAQISLIVEGSDLYVAEFPTLHALQLYAMRIHEDSPILYLHTVRTLPSCTYTHWWW